MVVKVSSFELSFCYYSNVVRNYDQFQIYYIWQQFIFKIYNLKKRKEKERKNGKKRYFYFENYEKYYLSQMIQVKKLKFGEIMNI